MDKAIAVRHPAAPEKAYTVKKKNTVPPAIYSLNGRCIGLINLNNAKRRNTHLSAGIYTLRQDNVSAVRLQNDTHDMR